MLRTDGINAPSRPSNGRNGVAQTPWRLGSQLVEALRAHQTVPRAKAEREAISLLEAADRVASLRDKTSDFSTVT